MVCLCAPCANHCHMEISTSLQWNKEKIRFDTINNMCANKLLFSFLSRSPVVWIPTRHQHERGIIFGQMLNAGSSTFEYREQLKKHPFQLVCHTLNLILQFGAKHVRRGGGKAETKIQNWPRMFRVKQLHIFVNPLYDQMGEVTKNRTQQIHAKPEQVILPFRKRTAVTHDHFPLLWQFEWKKTEIQRPTVKRENETVNLFERVHHPFRTHSNCLLNVHIRRKWISIHLSLSPVFYIRTYFTRSR